MGLSDGWIEGNVTFQRGRAGRGFHFDGTAGTRVLVPNHPKLNLTNALTLELWFRPDEDSNMGCLVSKRSGDSRQIATGTVANYGLYLGPIEPPSHRGISQFINDPEKAGGYHEHRVSMGWMEQWIPDRLRPSLEHALFRSSDDLFERVAFYPSRAGDLRVLRGQWHHLVGTFRQVDARSLRMATYLDGECRAQIEMTGCLANGVTDAPLSIGGFETHWFKGTIDEIRIYDRELGPEEVRECFHSVGLEPVQMEVRAASGTPGS
jgi:hypothetical protein